MNFETESAQLDIISEHSHWNLLKFQNSLLKTHIPQYESQLGKVSYYDVIEVVLDEDGKPFRDKQGACHVLTDTDKLSHLCRVHTLEQVGKKFDRPLINSKLSLQTYMLGEFIESLKDEKIPTALKVNPIAIGDLDTFLCEEILFAPIFDNYTQKYLMSSPMEARALLAMNPKDQKRWGIKIVFQTITNSDIPLDPYKREQFIKNKIQESHFVVPRVPIPRGSASIYCLLLNLENPIEEMAFIRDYQSFDPYTKVLYVNSNLEMITGNFEKVPYFVGDIDEIFGNLLSWYNEATQN